MNVYLHVCDQKRRSTLNVMTQCNLKSDFITQVEHSVMTHVFDWDRIRQFSLESKEERIEMAAFLCRLLTCRQSWSEYNRKIRSIIFNVRNSPEISRRIAQNQLTVDWLVSASPQQLWPDRWKDMKRNMGCVIVPEEATSTAFRCGKCKNRSTTVTQFQTRSADEPMTLYIKCVICNNCWKE